MPMMATATNVLPSPNNWTNRKHRNFCGTAEALPLQYCRKRNSELPVAQFSSVRISHRAAIVLFVFHHSFTSPCLEERSK
ncbi:hypothetical protein, partial [Mycobacteroides abscessus]|uniref:hypothetical protein n=1 Tax=Mycobacteroides abscessus TaxID=36809 RepID=UPI001A98F9F0